MLFFKQCPVSYNTPYEKIGDEVVPVDTPFDIPDSWEWVQFKDLVDYSMGKTPPRKETEYWSNGTLPWVSIADLVADGTVTATKECVNSFAAKNTFKGKISKAGTLLMSFKLTVGKVSILGIDAFHNEAIISIYPFVDPDKITTMFLFATLPLLSQSGDTKSAIKGNTLNSDSLDALLIPLPPIMEQKRIFDKLHELTTPLLDYGAAEQKVTELNVNFPEALKKSILQEAAQGKLVPQDPNDEPAEALLERIRAEKQRLVKEGKIKKDKHESVIFRRDNSHYEKLDGTERCIDDKLPFEIPDTWIWARLNTLGYTQTGNTPSTAHPEYRGDYIPFITPGDIADGSIDYTNQGLSEVGKNVARACPADSILQVCIGGSIGKAALSISEVTFNQQINAITPIFASSKYVFAVLTSFAFLSAMKESAGGTATPILNRSLWDKMYIPVPPLAEQNRIVQRIEELLPLVKGL